jgi:hypothetical protein
MRRALLVAAGVATLLGLTGSSSGAGGTDWKHLKYMLYETQQALLTTDGSWEGGDTVKPLQPGQVPPEPVSPFDSRVRLEYIWPRTCTSGEQHASMSKTFMVPGNPIEAHLELYLGFGYLLPFRSATYLVNNVPVVRIGDTTVKGRPYYYDDALPPAALKAFHYGVNRITIRADRKALKKGEACNSKSRLIGPVAQLRLRFEPDLQALPSSKGVEQAVRKQAGQVVGALGELFFVNRGPSGSPGGKLVFHIAGNSYLRTAWTSSTLTVTAPFHDCKGTGTGVAVAGDITCEYSDFPAGHKASVFAIVAARLEPNFPADGLTTLDLSWELVPGGGTDLNQANNGSSHKFVICGPRAKQPECASAK